MSLDVNFFTLKTDENKTYVIPNTTTEGTDSLSFSSNWTTANIQGSTEAVTAFNYVNNPNININLKFHEDSWREYPDMLKDYTFEQTIAGLASLQYPIVKNSAILPPYCKIEYNGQIYRGYFNNIKITQTGPFRRSTNSNGNLSSTMHRTICEFTGNFTIVKSKSPNRKGVAESLKTYFI